jgi:hypothetical protein
LSRQQQVLDLDVSAHSVGHQHVLQSLDGDRLEGLMDFRPAAPPPEQPADEAYERHDEAYAADDCVVRYHVWILT